MTLDDLIAQSRPSGGTATRSAGSSSSLDALLAASRPSKTAPKVTAKVAQYQQEENQAKADSTQANSTGGIIKNTISGLIPAAISGAKAIVSDPVKTLIAKPAIRLDQALATGAGTLIGGKTGNNLITAANQPVTLPGYLGGGTIEPQKNIGDGGTTQLASDALKSASYLVPAGRAEALGANLVKGEVAGATAGGALAGAQFGALGGAGDALAEDKPTLKGVATKTTLGTLAGAGGGALLGAGGAVLGKALEKSALDSLIEKSRPAEIPPQPETPPLPPRPVDYMQPKSGVPLASDDMQNLRIQHNTPVTNESPGMSPVPMEIRKPDSELPTIQMGAKNNPSDLPSIQTLPVIRKAPGDLSYEPISTAKPTGESAPVSKPVITSVPSVKVETRTQNVPINKVSAPAQQISGNKVSKASSDINKTLAAKGFAELPEEQQSRITPIKKTEQIQKVSDIITTDSKEAKSMAITGEGLPNDVHPQVLFNAVKNKAIVEGDGETLRALASSPIATDRALHAQALGASGFNNGETDAVSAVNDITKAREQEVARKTKTDITTAKKATVKAIKSEVRKTNPTKEDWHSFITNLTC